jgi:Ca2+-binding RTX toxin-like protein
MKVKKMKAKKTSKRAGLLVSVMAASLMLSATAALAATINCPYSGSCYGTSSADTIYGTAGNNNIYAYAGNDYLYGRGGDDYLYGQGGDDYLSGESGNDNLSGWSGKDKLYDTSPSSNDTYRHFFVGASEDRDVVLDYGGSSDVLDLTYLSRSQVFIAWVDTTHDADTNKDSLLIEKKGTTNSVLVRNYFDNSGGSSKGTGAIESIKFEDKTVGFPASEG